MSYQSEKPLERILFVEYAVGFGGSLRSLSELYKGLQDSGLTDNKVLLFQNSDSVNALYPKEHIINRKRRFNYLLKSRWLNFFNGLKIMRKVGAITYSFLDYLYSYLMSYKIYRVIKSYRINLLHLNNGYMYDGIRAAEWAKIPVVIHYRGFASESDFSRKINEKNTKIPENCLCIGISNAVTKSIQSVGIPKQQIATIYNPITQPSISEQARESIRNKYSVSDNELVYSIFGRITQWKGQLEFCQAITPILLANKTAKVLIVGDATDSADDSYLKSILSHIESNNLQQQIILTGFQSDVYSYYSASDVIVHNSLHPEPFGRVIIEGMICKKLVIAANEGGPSEIISHGKDGLLFEPRDSKSLQKALEKSINDTELRQKIGDEAYNTAQEYLTDAITRKVIQAYRSHLSLKVDDHVY
ncbi:glycosyltransferase family 4 protein [Pleionea mediterranea]|uniref:Glycosyltransferase involved in cell wall biosynthesis n=1 Tax=Pleionea mediterranea TaxID=523701 RepID=A0A316FYD7_9GAMM|nr:glycosyltransferase family 4 protein [Pleionea mediterranea]PWK53714.1 glycosyltransferase involved in cell wall biosynthesis [Pleionea mediterranea]